MDIQGIASRVKLVTLTTGQWRPVRKHHGETLAERQRHNTDAVAVAVTLTSHPAIKHVAALQSEAYQAHIRLTLPTVQTGLRMLPAGRELEHSDTMRAYADAHGVAVRDALAAYVDERASAPVRLGGLFDATMWPEPAHVCKCYKLYTRYLACPTDGAWADWLTESAELARDDMRERLRDAVARVAERCGDTDGRLHATVIDNLSALLAIAEDLNIAGDACIARIVAAAKPLTAYNVDTLRNDSAVKADIARQASGLLTSIAAGALS